MPDSLNGISPEKILSFTHLIAIYAVFFLKLKWKNIRSICNTDILELTLRMPI